MARLRTIKPGFFLDEYLAECSPLTRLLYAGLWTIADRDGRLDDRPKRIKVEILPYDECDVDALLWELSEHGFIVRYEVAGSRFIAIPTWHKHQSPHMKEAASAIPAPDEHSASTIQAPYEPPSSCLVSCLVSCKDSSSSNGDDGFSSFWNNYPRKVGKTDARKRWQRMTKKDRAAATVAAGNLGSYTNAQGVELQYIPHPSTFIGTKKKWEDWIEGPPAGYDGGQGTEKTPLCPNCEAELAWDGDGTDNRHCPVCAP